MENMWVWSDRGCHLKGNIDKLGPPHCHRIVRICDTCHHLTHPVPCFPLAAGSRCLPGVFDPAVAEALGVREVLSCLKLSHLSSVTVEMDYRLVYHALLSNHSSAIAFFRWVGRFHKPTPYAWNLMVDLLGKNRLFEPMWDAIRSMKQENVLSMATFASVFGSYCTAGRFGEAVMSFDVMDKYGIQQDIVAVNSL